MRNAFQLYDEMGDRGFDGALLCEVSVFFHLSGVKSIFY